MLHPWEVSLLHMLDENIRNLEAELEQGLVHIEKALLLAELYSQDMCCINTMIAAKALIQEFLWTNMRSVDDCHFFGGSCIANCGWSTMTSIFPVIEVQSEKAEHKQESHRSESGYNGFFAKCKHAMWIKAISRTPSLQNV